MFNLVKHAGHSIDLRLEGDQLEVYCNTCHDTRRAIKIGSFILDDKERESDLVR
jgi:hypothetical protein